MRPRRRRKRVIVTYRCADGRTYRIDHTGPRFKIRARCIWLSCDVNLTPSRGLIVTSRWFGTLRTAPIVNTRIP